MSNLPVLSLAAFALVIVACAAAPTGSATDAPSEPDVGAASSGSTAASTGTPTKVATSVDAGSDASAAAAAAADRCYSTCIAADPEAKSIDDGWVACKSSCTNGDCVATCNTAADAMCGQAANHTACTKLSACWTQCFGPA